MAVGRNSDTHDRTTLSAHSHTTLYTWRVAMILTHTSRSFENLPFVQAPVENIWLSCSFRIPRYSISIAIDMVLAHASN